MNKFFKILFSILLVLLFETSISYSEETKIKIGVLVPLSGENASLGKQILNSIRMALIDIKNNDIEIYPKDTMSDPDVTLRSALEFEKMGISLVIGPVFHKNLLFLDKVKNITFLSLTNKTLDLHKNIISSGINSSSQLNTIKKFLERNEIKKTIFLIPNFVRSSFSKFTIEPISLALQTLSSFCVSHVNDSVESKVITLSYPSVKNAS